MIKKIKELTCKALVLSMLASTVLPGFSGSAYGAYGEKAAADSEKTEYVLSEIESLLKGSAPYDILIKCTYSDDGTGLSRKEKANKAQRELLELLEQKTKDQSVTEYQSYYIVNAVHAVITSKELIKQIAELPNVEKITPNNKIELVEPVEDDEEPETASYSVRNSIFEPDEKNIEWGVSMVHADKVWDDFHINGEGVTVGIIDTGVNYNLPAIQKAFKGYDESTGKIDNRYYKDFIDDLPEPEASSVNDHGTHVAGTICGREGDNLNQIGVAPGAKYISARALNDEGGEVANLLEAAEWMLEQKPDVINNSWGGDNDDDDWFSEITEAWIEEGIVPVFAAGNQSSGDPAPGSIANPGNLLEVLSVGAVDRNKNLGKFSLVGPSAFDETGKIIKPEIVAPGVQVRSVDATGNYVSWNGTSMATPHVTGVVALLKQAAPGLSVREIKNVITETAEPLTDRKYQETPNMGYGYGLINAYDAVARLKGKTIGSISGTVKKLGTDTGASSAEFIGDDSGYLGRDVEVSVKVKEDVSIKKAALYYQIGQDGDEIEIPLKLTDGEQNDGIYGAVLDADILEEGELNLRAEITDYADNITKIEKTMQILPGIKVPWKQDFEEDMQGFLIEGNWKLSHRESAAEPEMPDDGNTYIGIDGGQSTFEKRVDSYLYLPPVDLSDMKEGDSVFLSADMYVGFTGISLSEIQASYTGDEDDWEVVYNLTKRPDITERKWEHNTYSLSKYAGNSKPLLLRFYFFGHDADSGVGWYLDNLELDTAGSEIPEKVTGLKAVVDQKGLCISFVKVEEPDVENYRIERRSADSEFEEVAMLDKDAKEEFINNGVDKTHYRILWYDDTAEAGETYWYRVQAVDLGGQEGPWSDEIKVKVSSYETSVSYEFDENDGGFTSEILSGEADDWEWSHPERPDDEYMDFILKQVWENLEKNGSGMWGTTANGLLSKKQDSCLLMPEFEVSEGDYFYFDSLTTESIVGSNRMTVEIREADTDEWFTLFTREEVQKREQQHEWQTLSKNLSKYAGKTVQVRFRVSTGTDLVSSYDLGWFIDNIFVSKARSEFSGSKASKLIATGGNAVRKYNTATRSNAIRKKTAVFGGQENISVQGEVTKIPLKAKVTVLETGKYTYASEIDGTYHLDHAVNVEKPYTLEVSAYGFETQRISVDLNQDPHPNIDFVLKEAPKAVINGIVADEAGNPLENAKVRVLENDSIPLFETDKNGSYTGNGVYAGNCTLRVFKTGYIPQEVKVTLTEGENQVDPVRLKEIGDFAEEEADYGFVVEETEGSYQTVHFTSGMKGAAVWFQSPHKGGILKSADIFLVNNNYYGGDHVEIGVLGYDKQGRLRELAPFREYENLVPNEWNKIDLTEYWIQRDEPVYIAVQYEKELASCMGVFYDVKASDKAKERSFVYDGAFTKTTALSVPGAYAMKASWYYPKNAEKNPESSVDGGNSGGDTGNVKPTDEEEFVFDPETQTITEYKGEKTSVVVPAKIKGVPVKRIGNEAFKGDGKDADKRLRTVRISEGIEEIGKDAFKNNNLQKIYLPDSLNVLEEGAFKYQWKTGMDDDSLTVRLPENIHIVEKSVFESAGSPLKVEMPGVLTIRTGAFAGNKSVEVQADVLEEIEDGAFGNTSSVQFEYAKVYTGENSVLESKDGQYLINPAVVELNMINAKDKEDVIKIGLKYGAENPYGMTRNYQASDFYRIGQTVTVNAPSFRDNGKVYVSKDKPQTLTLKEKNTLDFYYYLLEAQIRMPVLEGDKETVGFVLPGAEVQVTAGGYTGKTVADEAGYFYLELPAIKEGDTLSFTVNGQEAGSTAAEKAGNGRFVVKDHVLLRYVGADENVEIPNSIGNSGAITKIGDFAFFGKKINKVTLPDQVETVGAGAFMGTGLQEFGWNLNDINKAGLRIIEEYAFKDNELSSVKFPELMHAVRTGAFENNQIKTLELGKYTGHIGDRAFKNNQLKNLILTGKTEEIGKEAFMNNQLETLEFAARVAGAEETFELPEYSFAGNRLSEITLPEPVSGVEESAFADNEGGKVTLRTDVESIQPTKTYDVLRSDGTRLTLDPGTDKPGTDKPGTDKPGTDEPGTNKPGTDDPGTDKPGTDDPSTDKPNSGNGGNTGGGHSGSRGSSYSRQSAKSAVPAGYTGAVQTMRGYILPAGVMEGTWRKESGTSYWNLLDQFGNQCVGGWRLVYLPAASANGQTMPYGWFWFDGNGRMATGWMTDASGNTFYLNTEQNSLEGMMITGWQKIGENWYYFKTEFGPDMGKLLKNTVTPDGYTVTSDGRWNGMPAVH